MIEEPDIVRRERLCAIGLLGFVIIFTVLDVLEDIAEGSTALHVAMEFSIVAVSLATCIYLWRRVNDVWKKNAKTIVTQLAIVREDAARWRAEHSALVQGLSSAIERQLEEWGLSAAEKDVALLLIKGMSFKEIAQFRDTSDHTVRQQAATIYRKSGLEGRAQLSAFFFEEVLQPKYENVK